MFATLSKEALATSSARARCRGMADDNINLLDLGFDALAERKTYMHIQKTEKSNNRKKKNVSRLRERGISAHGPGH